VTTGDDDRQEPLLPIVGLIAFFLIVRCDDARIGQESVLYP